MRVNLKLSIVIPAFNVEKYILNTLISLKNQTDDNFEAIIVDDGSKDATYRVVSEFIRDNNIVNFKLIHQENRGVSSARNKGISEASGDYILLLDGDDFLDNQLVEYVLKILEKESYDILCWKFDQVQPDRTIFYKFTDLYPYRKDIESGALVLNDILDNRMRIWTGSAVYKKELLSENHILFSDNYYSGEDLEFTYKALIEADTVKFLNKTLSYYVQHEGSKTYSYNIFKFHSVLALQSVNDYIDLKNNSELQEISNKLRYSAILDDYLFNLKSCTKALCSQGLSARKAVKKVSEDLTNSLPEVKKVIEDLIENHPRKKINEKVRIQILSLSPYLYFVLNRLGVCLSNRMRNGSIKNRNHLRI